MTSLLTGYVNSQIAVTADDDITGRKGTAARDNEWYHAIDKIALIVANSNYSFLPRLTVPMKDAETLASLLMGLDFKTVTLADLTLGEMRAAVGEYAALLGNGVYAVFYFVGHGLEYGGQCYLLPVDAPAADYSARDCLAAQEVLTLMQESAPALNAILLDVCRKYPPKNLEKFCDSIPGGGKYVANRNTVYGFATSCGGGAYEVAGESHGIFMKYLKNYVNLHIPVTRVLEKVIQDVSCDSRASDFQFPEIRHNLSQPRSLADPILAAGHTKTFNLRSYTWQCLHALPEPRQIPVVNFGIKIVTWFDFYNYFTNVAYVYTSVEPLVGTGVEDHEENWVREPCSSEQPPVTESKEEGPIIESDHNGKGNGGSSCINSSLKEDVNEKYIAVLDVSGGLDIAEKDVLCTNRGKVARFLVRNFQRLEGPMVCSFKVILEESKAVITCIRDVYLGNVLVSSLNLRR